MRQVPRCAPERSGSEKARPPRPWSSTGDAPVLDAVRPLRHEGQRQAGDGRALGVAQERGEEHRLARAVDAALGVEQRVERAAARRGP